MGASGVQAGASELHRRRADVTPGQERGMPGKIGGISAGPENKDLQRRLSTFHIGRAATRSR